MASNEFQCKKIVLCQQQTLPLHTLPLFFYLFADKEPRETSKTKLFAATKSRSPWLILSIYSTHMQ